jgi:hypothetical protein
MIEAHSIAGEFSIFAHELLERSEWLSVGWSTSGQTCFSLRLPINGRPDMTSLIPESIFTWVSLIGTLAPPRYPNDDDDEEEKEDDHGADEDEPAVIREPDEDE